MEGFIKLNRKLLDWGWYSDGNTMRVFLDILLNANYKDGEYRGHKIKAGQCVIGRKALARKLGISEQSVRTALEHLKSTNEITIKSTNKFTVVTVENWAKYQCDEEPSNQQVNQQNNQQLTNNQPTTNQQLTTSKKGRKKEGKNNKSNLYRQETEEVIYYLNEVTGQHYKTTTQKTIDLITRWLKQDFTVSDFKEVIDKKSRQWMGDERMQKFLRPETLFGNKFEGYLNETVSQKREGRLDWIDDI